MIIIEFLGWAGASLLVLAYFLLVHKDLDRSSLGYHALNFGGSIFLGTNSYLNGAMPSFGISIIWALIAIYGFFHASKPHK